MPRVQLVGSRESAAGIWRRLPTIADYADGIGPHADDVSAELVAAAHARCLEVHPYTVNDRAEMVRLLEVGVDGVFTDRPALLLELRGEARPADDVPRSRCPATRGSDAAPGG